MIDSELSTYDQCRSIHERERESMRTCTHPEIAALAAMMYSHTHNCPMPDWCKQQLAQQSRAYLFGLNPIRRGRANGPVERYRRDMIDLHRWNTVTEMRKKQLEYSRYIKESEHPRKEETEPGPHRQLNKRLTRRLMKERNKYHKWWGSTWIEMYHAAASELAETPHRGGPDAIKVSYVRVQQRLQSPTEAAR